MKNSGPLEDRILIRELFGLYADASCHGDADGWLDLFVDDCQWNTHIFQCAGKPALRAQWDQLWQAFDQVGFLSEAGPIAVDGNTARARSQAREVIRLKDGSLFKLIGRYDDTLAKVNGEWRFVTRNYEPLVEEPPT